MSLGASNSIVIVPNTELLERALAQMTETVAAAHQVVIEKESFAQFSSYLEMVRPVLTELRSKGVRDNLTLRASLECLGRELKNAQDLVNTCRTKSKFYLFINSRSLVKKMQQITNDIGRALGLIPIAQLEFSHNSKEKIIGLLREMQDVEFKTALAADEVAGKIESGLKDHTESTNFSNELLMQIAKAVGVELNPALLRIELEQLKKDKENAELQKDRAEATQLEQIAALLSWADASSSLREREQRYRDKRLPLGSHPFPPLSSFCCPITQDVMEDPVDISSGFTFERAAIMKWFADGHTICPVTLADMENFDAKPNAILKRSINEWRERNAMLQLTAMKSNFASDDEEVLLANLEELCHMCQQRSIHRHWIAAEGLVPTVVSLLKSSKSSVRKKTLSTLTTVVKGNLDLKDRACQVGVVALAVRSLAREVSESRQAVALLLELSKEQEICKLLSRTRGCILLLVTMTNCEMQQAADDAQEVLENLSKAEHRNAVLMAEASYFGPLVQHLYEGTGMTKIIMANALSQIELTDKSRRLLVQLRALPPLVQMLSEGNLELKVSALGALKNLSRAHEIREIMIESGVMKPVLELLFTCQSVLLTVKEKAAIIFANLAAASSSLSRDHTSGLLGRGLDPKETIYQVLSLLNVSSPTIQIQLLRALYGMSRSPSAQVLRKSIREAYGVELLLNLYHVSVHADVRLRALKLLHVLTQDGGGTTLAREMSVEFIESLMGLLVDSSEDVKSIVMSLFYNVPIDDSHITDILAEAGLLPVIKTVLHAGASNLPIKMELVENAAGVMTRFTLSSNLPLQQRVAAHGVIPILVQLLRSGTLPTKCRCATSLGQLSESTLKRIRRVKSVTRWYCGAPQVEDVCRVHGGICSVERSFCLVEAQAIPVLIQALVEEEEAPVVEATLGALATLLYDECWDGGTDAIVDAHGVRPIIRLLTAGNTRVQENALWILERIFRKDRNAAKYGNNAQMPLIMVTQDGTNKARQHAARILVRLNVLQEQSSYF